MRLLSVLALIIDSAWPTFDLMLIGLLHLKKFCFNYLIFNYYWSTQWLCA